MRYCEDLISLFSLSEEQKNSLMKRIDSHEDHDMTYYAQYLVGIIDQNDSQGAVHVNLLTYKEAIEIIHNKQ